MKSLPMRKIEDAMRLQAVGLSKRHGRSRRAWGAGEPLCGNTWRAPKMAALVGRLSMS